MVLITGKQGSGKTTLLQQFKNDLKLPENVIFDEITNLDFIFNQFLIENNTGANFYIATQLDIEKLEKKFLENDYIPPLIIQKFNNDGVFSQITHEQLFQLQKQKNK